MTISESARAYLFIFVVSDMEIYCVFFIFFVVLQGAILINAEYEPLVPSEEKPMMVSKVLMFSSQVLKKD